jgi:hypothetical protein
MPGTDSYDHNHTDGQRRWQDDYQDRNEIEDNDEHDDPIWDDVEYCHFSVHHYFVQYLDSYIGTSHYRQFLKNDLTLSRLIRLLRPARRQ